MLHKATLNNQEFIIYKFLDYAENFLKNTETTLEKINQKINLWINSKTEEGFTALHFASFRGNI